MPSRLLLATLLVVTATACGDDDERPPDITVLSTTLGSNPATDVEDGDSPGQYVFAIAMIENTTDRAVGTTGRFTVLAADGTALSAPVTSVTTVVRARERSALGALLTVPFGSSPARAEVAMLPDEREPPQNPFPAGALSASATLAPGSVTGVVTSTYEAEVPGVLVTAVCSDSSGTVVGGGEARLEPIEAGGQLAYTVDLVVTTRQPTTCKSFPLLSAEVG